MNDCEGGSLSGIKVGIEDIIDVAGFPTRNGCKTCHGSAPVDMDAAVVRALRTAGETIVGKTATTEFAFIDPTDCRNPYDLRRSPEGSSSGSGAAVAAGMVDIALGTQTAGSLCRLAAYCGAVGFKPSFGVLPTLGVTPLAPGFDTVGIIARSAELSERAFNVMRADRSFQPTKDARETATSRLLLDATTEVAEEWVAAYQEAGEALRCCSMPAQPPEPVVDISNVVSDHRVVMNRGAFEAHGHLLADDRKDLLKPKFQAGLKAGAAQTPRDPDLPRRHRAVDKSS
jgi:Asp-tRNA(Asn)/Glu-tRNA(Gln) amidotransferase A subunit family amidase